MKRSEAIINIANVLRLTGNHYCEDGRDEQDAERILKRLEDIGMLPPFSNKMWEETINTYLEPQPYRWEPEEDENG